MLVFKKFIYYAVGIITLLTLVQLPFAFATTAVLSNPEAVQTTLKDSGAYEKLVPIVIDNVSENSKDPQTKQLLADPKVKEAITSSIEPADVEKSAQSIISGIYAWLEGETKLPEFTVDLSRSSDELTQKLSAYAEEKSSNLPVCTIAQLQTVDFEKDVLSVPCLPTGISPAQIGQQFSEQAAQQFDFIKNPIIDGRTILKDTDIQKAEQDAALGPRLYDNLHNSRWYLLGLVMVLISLLVYVRRDKRAGIRNVGILFINAGVITGVIALIIFFTDFTNKNSDQTVALLIASVSLIAEKIAEIIRWFSAGYIIAGLSILLYLKKSEPIDTTTTTPQTGHITKI